MKHSAEKMDEIGKFSFLMHPFHSGVITSIQTCLKRQNFVKLDIFESTFDEVLCLALHASGNYLVASFNAFLRFYNIFGKAIKHYLELPIKTCKEMKFSQFGSLIACQHLN
jgi:hypothetical protein